MITNLEKVHSYASRKTVVRKLEDAIKDLSIEGPGLIASTDDGRYVPVFVLTDEDVRFARMLIDRRIYVIKV